MENLTWNLESEYPSIDSHKYTEDLKNLSSFSQDLTNLVTRLEILKNEFATSEKVEIILLAQNYLQWELKFYPVIHDVTTFLNCRLSVDAQDSQAQQERSKLEILFSKIRQNQKLFELWLQRMPTETYNLIFDQSELKSFQFTYDLIREKSAFLLSEKEETMIQSLSLSGFQSWGQLYHRLSGTMKCLVTLDGVSKKIGQAEAHALTRSPKSQERETAWRGITMAWQENEETAAAILNSISGWRLELNQKRSAIKKVHFLDDSLASNRLRFETLQAMNQTIENNRPQIQKIFKLMSKALGQEKLNPWDLLAPPPQTNEQSVVPIGKALTLIRDAFTQIDPKFGTFIDIAQEKGWIETRVMPNKTTGAFCCDFLRSKSPRVFMTYMGSNQDISTLAHELGHAFHTWTMRDMDLFEKEYPSTLAETASIFTETLLRDSLLEQNISPSEKFAFLWGDMQGATSLLINIPARFEFESQFYQQRSQRTLLPRELCQLTDQAWSKWYGTNLTTNDTYFWAHKLHFAMTGSSFYNYPYTFGYLFGLSIYARRKSLGADFSKKYTDILKDTGRMKAEELILKHLGEDISQVAFWQKAIDQVFLKIERFETLVLKMN